jgi:hypothetical protein
MTGTLRAEWSKRGVLELRMAGVKNSDVEKALLAGIDCCAVCTALKGGTCREVESPLYGMTVDPMGKCQEFQAHPIQEDSDAGESNKSLKA